MAKDKFELPSWFAKAREIARREWAKHGLSDRNAVYLSNPSANRKIDEYIYAVLWPTAIEALKGKGFRLQADKPLISQEWHVSACRLATILLEDPKRPFEPGNCPPWHCRLGAKCFANNHVMLEWDFSISLPSDCEWRMLIDLLEETSDHGLPSKLTMSDDLNRKYHVTFEGGGSGDGSRFRSVEERIDLKMKGFCDFAETAYELENDCHQKIVFRRLIQDVNRIMSS